MKSEQRGAGTENAVPGPLWYAKSRQMSVWVREVLFCMCRINRGLPVQ